MYLSFSLYIKYDKFYIEEIKIVKMKLKQQVMK